MMCAIAGILGLTAGEETRDKMLKTMHRRGPDGKGVFSDGEICLLHTRLAVIDPQGGAQPMTLDFAGEEFVLVYNGELYNTRELPRELEEMGHCFVTHSDTEVVLHAWAQWREESLNRLNGIYAFALWERKKRRLYLARDRIGVKPLFYTRQRRGLLFASEIKTLLAHPHVKPALDAEGAAQLLLLGPGRLPGSGVFSGIEELEPGCYAIFDEKLTVIRYWKLTDRPHTQTFDETSRQVRELVTDAVKRQMVSDVPIGTFLSGGLDSSLISAICAAELKKRGEVLPAFSLDYENNAANFVANFFQPESDTGYIHTMEDWLGCCVHWTVLSSRSLFDALEEATLARDLPGMADVDFSLLLFSRQIRSQVKVALSGECADEIFGGYPWYRDPKVRAAEGFPWAQNTMLRWTLLNPDLRDRISAREFVMDAYRDTCRASDILPETGPEDRRIKEMVNLNFRWFMQTLLDRKDRMSMYHSLEVRVPFCDYRIAEYLYSVPWRMKDHGGQEKGLLRHAMEGLLPPQILFRKKSPYPKTFDPGYERLVTKGMLRLLSSDSPLFSLVDREQAGKLLKEDAPWPWYGQLMRRPQTLAYLLQLDFWLKHYQVELLF